MSSGFISESVIEEKKKQRQLEWEQVRKPEDPKEAPEEPVDTRSLFERLQANKTKAQEEWDEAHKLKNQIRGIDDDEANFLDTVDNIRAKVDLERRKEERREIEDYRKTQEKLREQELEARLQSERATVLQRNKSLNASSSSTAGSAQSKLVMAAVKKRSSNSESRPDQPETKKSKDEPKAGGALLGLGDYASSSEED